jgi:hypothetical protein
MLRRFGRVAAQTRSAVWQTQIEKNSDVYKENDAALRADVAMLRERVAEVSLGGGEKVILQNLTIIFYLFLVHRAPQVSGKTPPTRANPATHRSRIAILGALSARCI